MPRFFVAAIIPSEQETITLESKDSHHIKNVLRLKKDDQIEVCDRSGMDFTARISTYKHGLAVLKIISRQPGVTEPPYRAVLYQGLAKGDKMDSIIQKSVELGVSQIVPVICSRSVVRWNKETGKRKIERWEKISRSAAGQCGRGQIPQVADCLQFPEAIARANNSPVRIIPWEGERSCSLREHLDQQQVEAGAEISIFIGPEGGFTADEIEEAISAGIRPVTLGRRILRTETAGPAVLAMLIYRFSDF